MNPKPYTQNQIQARMYSTTTPFKIEIYLTISGVVYYLWQHNHPNQWDRFLKIIVFLTTWPVSKCWARSAMIRRSKLMPKIKIIHLQWAPNFEEIVIRSWGRSGAWCCKSKQYAGKRRCQSCAEVLLGCAWTAQPQRGVVKFVLIFDFSG